jgi:hypothetical protein
MARLFVWGDLLWEINVLLNEIRQLANFFVRFITILKSLSSVSTINILCPLQVAFHLLLRNASLMYDTRSTTPIAADQSADHRKPTVDAANVGHADRKTA